MVFIIHVSLFTNTCYLKSINIALRCFFLNPVSKIPIIKESSSSKNKDVINTVPKYWIFCLKKGDFLNVLLNILTPQKIVP